MKINLHRYRHTPYGIDGYLEISGRQLGHTTEHPLARLPPGEYPITLERPILKRGNGPFRNLDGSINLYDPTSSAVSEHPWDPNTIASGADVFYALKLAPVEESEGE